MIYKYVSLADKLFWEWNVLVRNRHGTLAIVEMEKKIQRIAITSMVMNNLGGDSRRGWTGSPFHTHQFLRAAGECFYMNNKPHPEICSVLSRAVGRNGVSGNRQHPTEWLLSHGANTDQVVSWVNRVHSNRKQLLTSNRSQWKAPLWGNLIAPCSNWKPLELNHIKKDCNDSTEVTVRWSLTALFWFSSPCTPCQVPGVNSLT